MNKDRIFSSRSNAAPSVVGKKRTRFNLSQTRRYTCNTGDFVPVLCEEVLPGDTFDIKTAVLTRLQTSLHQTLDNAFLEIAFFYVPNRIIMDDWDKLLGANDDPWARTTVVTTPQIELRGGSGSGANTRPNVKPMSLLNHLMLPAGEYLSYNEFSALTAAQKEEAKVSMLPLRAVFQVWDDWFRSENLDSVIAFSKGNSNVALLNTYTLNGSSFRADQAILKVNRFHDRFSSALPAPQKGAPVTFSLGGTAPVITGDYHSMAGNLVIGDGNIPTTPQLGLTGNQASATSPGYNIVFGVNRTSANDPVYMEEADMEKVVSHSNLVADLTNATAVTVNDLRLAIATQVLSEQEARCGTRLQEVLFSQWNLKAPSLMLDRSEYLGGKRIPLSMLEVVQTSATDGTKLLGNVAGLGKTFDADSGSALKSFMLHGYILGFAWIRTARSYSQGIDRKFFRSDKYSYFNPIFDNIGELPVKGKELFVPTFGSGYAANQWGQVFGYQEAWYEYKEGLNRDTGYMQTGISGSVDEWHYGDKYTSIPLLAHDWLKEGVTNVDRTIAVQSTATYGFQWSIMIDFEMYATRQMAKYSIPNTFGFGSR